MSPTLKVLILFTLLACALLVILFLIIVARWIRNRYGIQPMWKTDLHRQEPEDTPDPWIESARRMKIDPSSDEDTEGDADFK